MIIEHVRDLAAGKPIQRPVYDFKTHSRTDSFDLVTPAEVVIVEGILALHYDALRPFYTMAIYVEAPHEVCLNRRIHRDVRERGRTEESVREQFWATAHPMAVEYVLPSAAHATVTVNGCESIDWSIEQILSTLHRRGLLPRG
jgi:uridine kinase